jgi:iron complex transport system ATP-binding protein
MGQAVIEIEKVSFCRKDREILDGVDWQILSGQHWALLGANGSGKTTLLKIITGYQWPTFGRVNVLGREFGAADVREMRKIIGLVSSALMTRLPVRDTAAEIVASGLEASIGLFRNYGDEEVGRAREMLGVVNCSSLADERFEVLSQGEQQKVLIARALINRPKLIVLDEPCIGLDPAARKGFLDELGRLVGSDEFPNIVYVTHHIEEICPWISDVMVLKAGRVLKSGAVGDVVNSETLSEAFDCNCEVGRSDSGYCLRIVD